MTKDRKERIAKRIISFVMLFGILWMVFGAVASVVTGNIWWQKFASNGILILISPIVIGLIYFLSLECFGIKDWF